MSIAKKFLQKSVGQLDPFDYLMSHPHSAAPCHNLNSDVSNLEDSDDVLATSAELFRDSVKFSYPMPVNKPRDLSLEEANGIDPLLKLISAKEHFMDEKNKILKQCDTSMIPSMPHESKGRHNTQVHPNFATLVKWIENDPDPNFKSNYNWYYTGGNIKTTVINGERYLIKPTEFELGISKLSGRNFNVEEIENFKETVIKTKGDGGIFQIDAVENLILVRKKNHCDLFELNNEVENIQRTFQITDSFISCALKNKNECATLSPDREISIWDPQRGNIAASTITCEGINVKDSWGQIYYSKENQIVFLDRSTVYLIDPRTHMYGRGTLKFEVNDVSELCEEIFCGLQSPLGLHYISTSHQLLGLDPRQGWCQRWTHGLSPSPCFIATDHQYSIDMMVVGCQRTDNIAYFENQKLKYSPFSALHPYWIPSLSETLNKARCENLYLSPHLNPRFNFGLTGLCCYVEDGLNILRATSSGDVFLQKKLKSSDPNCFGESEVEVMSFWGNECEKLHRSRPKKFFATKVIDADWIFKDTEHTKLSEVLKEAPEVEGSWGMSKETVFSCCDVIAKKIVPVWELEDEEEWSTKEEKIEDEVPSDDEMDASERVRRWFENYCDAKLEVTTDDPELKNIKKAEENFES